MFTHLHVHTSYSFLDGYSHIPKLVSRAKELGMESLAITDHNHMGGIYEFLQECKKQDIKPILGYEGYQTWDTLALSKPVEERWADAALKAKEAGDLTEKEAEDLASGKKGVKGIKDIKARAEKHMYDTRQYHLILLAKNQTGLNNLIKLQSESAKVCTYNGRFLFDMPMLRKYSEGVICTTACVANMVASRVRKDDLDKAEELILEYKDIFGDDFYLEVQPNAFDDQVKVNNFYLTMSQKHNIKLVATSDVHYVLKADNKDHDVLVCVGTGTDIYNPNRMKYDHNFWLKSEEEMQDGFKYLINTSETEVTVARAKYALYLEAMHNTQEIANKVGEYKLGSDVPLMPKLPGVKNTKRKLRELAYKGLYELAKRYDYIANDIKRYEQRLAYELNIINYKDFADYMLIVREYLNWADNNGVMTGPGRGSAAGSLVLWCIGITKNVDPIKHGLLFGRFLTIDRTGLPDIDSDVSYYGRDKVIEHIKDLYGESNVAHIGTYSQMGVKSGLKDIGRALKIPFDKMNALSKIIDDFKDVVPPQPKFKHYDALKDGNATEQSLYTKWQKLEADNKELFRLARAFEGLKRNFGVHASGVLAMPCRVDDYFPTRTDADGVMITLFTGVECEELGTAKLDVLGLKTLSIIETTLKHLDKDVQWLYDSFDIEDKKLYKLLAQAKTDCVFQLESDMFKDMLRNMKPNSFGDISVATSIGRPGPLSAGLDKQYIACKNGKSAVEYPIHGIENILDDTYGIIAYQEQLMQIAKQVSGFDDNQADSIVRKIIAKKKASMFPMMIRCHIYGKKNCEGPEGWEQDDNAPWYDPKGKYGPEIKGAVSNGYTPEEMNYYFDYISGFSSYAFNRSHAVAYSFISMLTTWLKLYHPVEFFAAYLSMQSLEDLVRYIPLVRKEGIDVEVPDINVSNLDFTPNGNTILFGLGSIKGVGLSSIPSIIEHRPYTSLEDAMNKIGKKAFNKRVGSALIKSGAFSNIEYNRSKLMNQFYDLRKDKDERLNNEDYGKELIMSFEMETLNCPVTYTPEWFSMEDKTEVENVKVKITKVDERKDKSGNLMAFCKGDVGGGVEIDLIVFSSIYLNNLPYIKYDETVYLSGKKESDSKMIVKKVSLS